MSEGHIWIDEVIDDSTYEYVKSQLAQNVNAKNLTLHIASPGGSVYAGYKIYHALKNSRKPIHSIIEGEAQSMATYIALAGEKISICNPSVFMIHNPHSGVEGTATQMIQGANELITIEEDMAQAYASKTKLPLDKVKEMMAATTTLNAQGAKDLGFVDEVIPNSYLKAVALGKPVKKMEKKNFIQKTLKLVAEALGEGPTAMDVKTDKGVLSIQSEDGEFAGKPATLNGQPASGTYMLEDGRSIVCENGMVVSVNEAAKAQPTPAPAPAPAPMPAPAPVQTAEQRLAAMEAELQQIKAQKEAAEQAKAAAEAEKLKTAQALGQIKKELEEEQSKTVGDDNPPSKGMKPILTPVAMGAANGEWQERTALFLNQHFSWLKDYYPAGHFEKTVDATVKRLGPQAVSILETSFNYTYNGLLTQEIYYKPSQSAPALADIFTIDQDIKSHKQYNLVTQLNKVVKPYTGCDRTFNGNRQLITNTTVRTKEFNVSESWCKDDFTGYLTGSYNNLAQEWLKTGIDSFDPSGTPINRVIDKLLSEAIKRDIFRRASFAAGNSSDDDYNQIDGLWDRLIDSSGASNYCVRRAGSSLGTADLSSGNALTYLEQAYAQSNILLKEQIDSGNATFWVTRSIWDNYYNSLIGNGAVTEQAFANLQKGITYLTYKGIPVRPVGLWDTFLAESDNPLFATTRHLILLTIKENHILGVENGSDLNRLEGWYERKDRKFYYEADFKLGYNYLHCDLQTIMY